MSEPRKIVVVGAGLGGASAAAALRERGYTGEVLLIGSDPHRPYELPPLSKGVLAGSTDEPDWVHDENHYNEHDIKFTPGVTATRVELGVRLVSGEELPADVVLVAVGAAPRVELAHAAGLELADDGGVSVDAGLRTAAPDVYAVGDIASHFHPHYGHRIRVEHWSNAKEQGTHVAGNLLGENEPYLEHPYFFS